MGKISSTITTVLVKIFKAPTTKSTRLRTNNPNAIEDSILVIVGRACLNSRVITKSPMLNAQRNTINPPSNV